MIINDAGYGLLFVAAAMYLRWCFTAMTVLGYRLWKLTLLLGSSCIIWGVLMHSFFSIPLPPDHPLLQGSLLNWLVQKKTAYHMAECDSCFEAWRVQYPAVDEGFDAESILLMASRIDTQGKPIYEMFSAFSDQILMELALAVGIVHIILSLMRYARRSWSHIGWIAFIIGGYLYLPGYLQAASMWQYLGGITHATAAYYGLYFIGGGLISVLVISLINYRWKGIFELLTASQILGDVLSYIRLYALGMAGAIMSATINEMAAMAGVIGGIFVLLIGHSFNITLGIMGGVIHGLRLNFLEWYHYSFEGGGKLFQPLQKIHRE
jgi:V/A-type H+-transporting ATPase subunit I